MTESESLTIDVYGAGRDAGKVFHVHEIDPVTFSGYVLRLISALNVESYEGLIAELRAATQPADGREPEVPIDTIMRILQGSDPRAVHTLVTDLLQHVGVAPDPRHPGVDRALLPDDIRELKTLGDILMAIVKLNFGDGK